jgi:hypothetical protein
VDVENAQVLLMPSTLESKWPIQPTRSHVLGRKHADRPGCDQNATWRRVAGEYFKAL